MSTPPELGSVELALLWGIAAALLAAAEIVAPGFYLVWLGGAAGVTALLTALLHLPVEAEFGLFALAALASVLAARRLVRPDLRLSEDPFVNERAARLIGREVVVVEPLARGEGRVRLGDATWLARGPDMPAGTLALVRGVDGGALRVEPILPAQLVASQT